MEIGILIIGIVALVILASIVNSYYWYRKTYKLFEDARRENLIQKEKNFQEWIGWAGRK